VDDALFLRNTGGEGLKSLKGWTRWKETPIFGIRWDLVCLNSRKLTLGKLGCSKSEDISIRGTGKHFGGKGWIV